MRGDRVRSFLALLLPPELITAAAEIEKRLRVSFPPQAVKWVEPELFHLTVRFFGDLDREQLEKARLLVAGLDRAFAAVRAQIDGISAFPSPARPQTLWISLRDPQGRLDRLAESIDGRIREAGFGPPDKPWKSHLTIGRVRREHHLKVDPSWTRGLTWPGCHFTISTVALMQSELRPQGPRYTPLQSALSADSA